MLRKSLKTKTLFVCIFRLKKLTMGCHMQRKENMIYLVLYMYTMGLIIYSHYRFIKITLLKNLNNVNYRSIKD